MLIDQVVENPAAPEEGTTAAASATVDQTTSQEGTAFETREEIAARETAEAAAAEAKRNNGVQKRIDELTRKAKETERENDALRRLLVVKQPEAEAPKPAAVADKPNEEPKEEDFATTREYIDAVTDWKLDERERKAAAARFAETAQTQQQQQLTEFKAKQDAYKAVATDFDEVIAGANMPVSPALIHEVTSHEDGAALQYFLAKNPGEVERLNKLSPLALAREIGRLEPRFKTAPVTPPARTTTAPPPITPGGRSTTTAEKDPGDMSPAEYRVWRAKKK